MKLIDYLKIKKNRYILITINVLMSIILSLLAVYLDERLGSDALIYIYIFQAISIINWITAFALIIWRK